MSYSMYVEGSNLCIPASKIDALTREMRDQFSDEVMLSPEYLQVNQWQFHRSSNSGNIDWATLDGCTSWGDTDTEVMNILARHVEKPGWIEMTGEGGERWRWLFKDGECKEVYAVIMWPTEIPGCCTFEATVKDEGTTLDSEEMTDKIAMAKFLKEHDSQKILIAMRAREETRSS